MKKGIALFYWQEIGDCMVETSFSVDTEMEMDMVGTTRLRY